MLPLAVSSAIQRGCLPRPVQVSFGLDGEKYPVTAEWKVRLEDPENGTASLYIGEGIISSAVTVQIKDLDKPAGGYLTDPEGTEYYIPAIIEKDWNGVPSIIY